ncbi:hypothetical protein ABZS66_15260 [Dactylosporangium sp. NPDC005572]|uniref:hypothetical protein n=1 Tax=Dactylosporangium sp. NPDC005572 TaxID=3156889 RepID=UPI00339DCF87
MRSEFTNGETRLLRWQRVRDYAVPPAMIESATARRAAGDWAGACAAAHADVDLDLRAVARTHGRDLAGRLRADLRRLAPDLLRWHLPRIAPDGLLRPGLTVALARYYPGGVHLVVRTAPAWADAGQRLSLAVWDPARPGAGAHPHARPDRRYRMDLHRHLWDATRAPELRDRAGTGPPPDAPDDLAGCAVDRWPDEAALLLRADGHAAGPVLVRLPRRRLLVDVALDVAPDAAPSRPRAGEDPVPSRSLAGDDPDLSRPRAGDDAVLPRPRAGDDTVLSRPRAGADAVLLRSLAGDDTVWTGPRAGRPGAAKRLPVLPHAATWLPPDIELLRAGLIDADRLHPLVAAALGMAPAARERAPAPPERIVECRGARHRLGLVDGVLAALDHAPDEVRREELLAALGGPPLPCLQAVDDAHRRPHSLDDIRARLEHGDTAGAVAAVEALLGPQAVPRTGALRDDLAAAAARRVTHGLFRAGLTGLGPTPPRPTR